MLREEGQSLREIARSVGCAAATVHAVLARDPSRLEQLITLGMRVRADQWKVVEERALRLLLAGMEDVEQELKAMDGTVQRAARIALARDWAPTLRLTAADAATKTQLLQDRATERIGGTSEMVAAEMTAEDCVRVAVEAGIEHDLPPRLAALLVVMRRDGRLTASTTATGPAGSES